MKNVWTVLKLGIALLGLLLTGARSSSAEGLKARKSFKQPVSEPLVKARKEGKTGEDQEYAHNPLDHTEMLGKAPQEDQEPVDGERRKQERNAEARGIDRQEDCAFAGALLGRGDRENGGE